MLRSYLLIAGVAAASLAFSAAGCGGGVETPSTGAGGHDDAGAPPSVHAEPPKEPAAKEPDGTGDATFAISKLYLGDVGRDGSMASAWKKFGYDLDGKVSTLSSTDLCKPRNNASPKSVYPDGDDGIDNAFGKSILPIILGTAADTPQNVNAAIVKGEFTIMLSVEKLGTGTEYNPLLTRLYGGATLDPPPLFDGTDRWPVRPELLSAPPDLKSAKVQFAKSYLVKNTWVSGTKGNVNLDLSISGFSLSLNIASAVITMELDAEHKTVKNGTIAGVLETEVLATELKKVAGAFSPTLCDGATIDGIISQLEQASDILKDGTQDPTKTCDGISIGLGFDAALVQLGDPAEPAMPAADPCTKAP